MSNKTVIRKLKQQPDVCPWCDASDGVDVYDIEEGVRTVTQAFRCTECSGVWEIVYKLTGVNILTTGGSFDSEQDILDD